MSESPRAYREKNPYNPPPPDYKPPSMLVEHKGLAVLFAVISVGFALYCLKSPHPAPRARGISAAGAAASVAPSAARGDGDGAASTPARSANPAAPIYIETIPEERTAH